METNFLKNRESCIECKRLIKFYIFLHWISYSRKSCFSRIRLFKNLKLFEKIFFMIFENCIFKNTIFQENITLHLCILTHKRWFQFLAVLSRELNSIPIIFGIQKIKNILRNFVSEISLNTWSFHENSHGNHVLKKIQNKLVLPLSLDLW